jgi:DNA-directed RNA polymerase specialized sigma24 family protein
MNPPVTGLSESYVMSQAEVADKMFLCKNTVMNVEKRAMEKFKKRLEERGIKIEDLLDIK